MINKVDSLGNELSKEQQEFFKDSQVVEGNTLLLCYHGTNTAFKTFRNAINWFSTNKEYATHYAEFRSSNNQLIYEAYLNCKHLYDCGNTNGRVYDLIPTMENYQPNMKRIFNGLGLNNKEREELIDKVVEEREKEGYVDNRASYKYKLRVHIVTRTKVFRDVVMSKGYDGIRTEEENGSVCFGVFDSIDIKLVSNKKPTLSSNIDETISKRSAKLNDREVSLNLTHKHIDNYVNNRYNKEEGGNLVMKDSIRKRDDNKVLKLESNDMDAFKKDNSISKRMYTLTTNKDADDNEIPSYCYIKDLEDEFELSDNEIIELAKKEGYKIFKTFSNEEVDGGIIIAHEKCTSKIIKDEFKKDYGVDIEVEKVDSSDGKGPKYERLLKTSSYAEDIDMQMYNNSFLENVEKHETLNPKLWNEDGTLKKEVHDKIIQITNEFIEDLKQDGIKFDLKDIRLVGSNCSYNYNDKSDLDIHLIMNTESLECPDNLYPLLYSAYRSLFNKKLDIDFYGIPVEIYVEVE